MLAVRTPKGALWKFLVCCNSVGEGSKFRCQCRVGRWKLRCPGEKVKYGGEDFGGLFRPGLEVFQVALATQEEPLVLFDEVVHGGHGDVLEK